MLIPDAASAKVRLGAPGFAKRFLQNLRNGKSHRFGPAQDRRLHVEADQGFQPRFGEPSREMVLGWMRNS
jgi:hypothetical protein